MNTAMPRQIKYPLLLAALVSASALAKDYSMLKPALVEAIDAPDGKVSGRLVGPAADLIVQTTKSNEPVTLEISTLKSFKKEGCKQFKIILTQAGVPTKEGGLGVFQPIYTLNMCRDGTPPVEGMDLEALGKIINERGSASSQIKP